MVARHQEGSWWSVVLLLPMHLYLHLHLHSWWRSRQHPSWERLGRSLGSAPALWSQPAWLERARALAEREAEQWEKGQEQEREQEGQSQRSLVLVLVLDLFPVAEAAAVEDSSA